MENGKKTTTVRWGQQIIDDFLQNGGFQQPDAMQAADEKFWMLFYADNGPEDAWKDRCDFLAVWALICIELERPADNDLDLLIGLIRSALQGLPEYQHANWFGQLAFDLLQVYGRSPTDTIDLGNVSDSLFLTIKQTTKAIWGDEFTNKGHVNYSVLGCLFGKDVIVDLRELIRTKDLLERLANEGVDEALFFLSMGFGSDSECETWLGRAAEGSWPTSPVARFQLACILRSENRRNEFLRQVRLVKFPDDDHPEYDYLCQVAIKAGSVTLKHQFGQNLVDENSGYEKWNDDWSSLSLDVTGQWDTVRRCCVDLDDLISAAELSGKESPISLPEYKRSLSLETGRLIEVFLKWSLCRWFPKEQDLDRNDSISGQDADRFSRHIGNILGRGDSEEGISLDELLRKTDTQLTTEKNKKHEVGDLIGMGRNALNVWKCTNARLPSLIVANAIAAKSHFDHHFGHAKSLALIDAIRTFRVAYSVRNENAHYMREKDTWVTSYEVSLLANSVLTIVDQFMSLTARLNAKR